MKKSLLKILPLFCFLILCCNESFAQTPDQPQPQKESFDIVKPEDVKKELKATTVDMKEIQQGVAKVKGGIAGILLGNSSVQTLMFDEEEINNIDLAIDSLRNGQVYSPSGIVEVKDDDAKNNAELASEENEKSYIYLASIMYFSPQDWVVWINDKKITSQDNKANKELYIKLVQKDQISVVWNITFSKWKILAGRRADESTPRVSKDNKVQVKFDLHPNQTFILSSNSIVEGRAVLALLKKKEQAIKTLNSLATPSAISAPAPVNMLTR